MTMKDKDTKAELPNWAVLYFSQSRKTTS